jgi:hypothetical protein
MFALSQASDQDLQVVILLLELHVHLNLLLRVVVRHQLVVLCSQRQQLVGRFGKLLFCDQLALLALLELGLEFFPLCVSTSCVNRER